MKSPSMMINNASILTKKHNIKHIYFKMFLPYPETNFGPNSPFLQELELVS